MWCVGDDEKRVAGSKVDFFTIISSSFLIFVIIFAHHGNNVHGGDDEKRFAGSKVDWIQPQHQFDQLHSPQ